jgi:hypothetical protein
VSTTTDITSYQATNNDIFSIEEGKESKKESHKLLDNLTKMSMIR